MTITPAEVSGREIVAGEGQGWATPHSTHHDEHHQKAFHPFYCHCRPQQQGLFRRMYGTWHGIWCGTSCVVAVVTAICA